jgi:DNA-directed RNA polymerase subunit RPC12/RpoP
MSISIRCSNCAATLHPTGRSPRVRCGYCNADVLLDPDTVAALAQAVPVAPPEVMARFEAVFQAHFGHPENLLHELAPRLERALPGQVELGKAGLLHSHINRVAAQIGDWLYEAQLESAKLVAHRKHHVRGIVLKSTPLTPVELVSALAGELHELAQQGPPSDAVLHRFFGG